VERFTLPEALKDTNTKLGENVQSLVRPLADPTVRAVQHPIPTARFLPCASVRSHSCAQLADAGDLSSQQVLAILPVDSIMLRGTAEADLARARSCRASSRTT